MSVNQDSINYANLDSFVIFIVNKLTMFIY